MRGLIFPGDRRSVVALALLLVGVSPCRCQEAAYLGFFDFRGESPPPLHRVLPDKTIEVRLNLPDLPDVPLGEVPRRWEEPVTGLVPLLQRCRSTVFLSIPKGKKPAQLLILFKDVSKSKQSDELHFIQNAMQKQDGPFAVLVIRPDTMPKAVPKQVKDFSMVEREWFRAIESGRDVRYAVFRETLVLEIAPKDAAARRLAIATPFLRGVGRDLADFPTAAARQKLTTDTQSFFAKLSADNVMNAKLQIYALAWQHQMRFVVEAGPPDATTRMEALARSLAAAEKDRDCTVTVSTTPKDAALARGAKAADAKAGRFKDLGKTVYVGELEPANYIFRSYRQDKMTGQTTTIDCTGKTAMVVIEETQ